MTLSNEGKSRLEELAGNFSESPITPNVQEEFKL